MVLDFKKNIFSLSSKQACSSVYFYCKVGQDLFTKVMIVAECRCCKDIILASCIQTLRSINYFNLSLGELTRTAVSVFTGEGDWHSCVFRYPTAFLTRLDKPVLKQELTYHSFQWGASNGHQLQISLTVIL